MYRNVTERGFDLIELVVVIAILAILTAFAVPRFLQLQVQARVAAVEGLATSVRSAAALAHSLWLASGQPATVSMGERTITMVNGYPDLETIDDAMADTTGFDYAPADGVFQMRERPGDCRVVYGEAPDGGLPSIVHVTDDC